jgi:hypothetical protein
VKRSEVFWISGGALQGEELRKVGTTKSLGSVWEVRGKVFAEAKGNAIVSDFSSREQAKRVVVDMVCG